MGTLVREFHHGLRALLRSPGFTLIVVFTLALGIGANSTIFSWINSTILNPIPGVRHASQFIELTTGSEGNEYPLSYPDYADLRDGNQAFSSLVAYSLSSADITGNAKPQRVWAMFADSRGAASCRQACCAR